ncbi:hypothetical protein BDW02DRAFT_486031 [Decorospora gaudefroyi]|uniref:Uncharacterized protein n=1 Tax=Decorospora gaudefroyi TaxID=184978 RepID=A0A6A5KQT5_9PLEO|nr:hypothetical protein BDW02DRAFT_486031 [Decorospora gaudefroyi]
MCGCTLYDSPTCGHSWISMSQPCGYLSDLLSCPNRHTYQTLVAPPYTCPICNGGFADRETIEMVQGPWGCNQMIRNQLGGNYAVPGQWGNATGGWGGPAITSGPMSGAMIPVNHMNQGFTYDHRLTGPNGPQAMVSHAPMIANGTMMGSPAMITNGPMVCGDGFGDYDDGCGGYYDDRRKRRRRKSHYKYKYTDKPATNCTVM